MYFAPQNSCDSYYQKQYGIDLVSKVKFSKNGKNLNEVYLFKFNSEKILLEEFIQNEFIRDKPKLIISLNCELKRSDLMSTNQMNIFTENIERLISDNETWIIGSGLNVGIHKMIGKIVRKIKLVQNNGFPNLIGINNWQHIIDNENINSNSIEYIINTISTDGRFSLNSYYETFFFMDDNEYEKEISFYNDFDKLLKKYEAFSVQIVYGGDKMNLDKAYSYLKGSNLIVVVKDSGGIADLIAIKMDSNDEKYDEAICNFNFNETDLQLVKDWMFEMHENYRNEIIIFDLRNKDFRLDEALYQALMKKKMKSENRFNNSLIFDEEVINKFDIPEITNIKKLKEIVRNVLLSKKLKLLKLLLSNIKNIDKYFTNKDMEKLYKKSVAINDEDKGELNNMCNKYFKLRQTAPKQENNDIENGNMINEESSSTFVNGKELFIWSINSEFFETARVIFGFSKEYLATALHGIIKLKSKSEVHKNNGHKQLSNRCLEESLYYENIYKDILNEIYEKFYLKSISCLLKPQKLHGNQSIIQTIIKENVEEICNTNACELFLQKVYECVDDLPWHKKKENAKSTCPMRKCSPKLKYITQLNVKSTSLMRKCSPKLKYITHFISYVIFLLLFIYFNLVELNTFDIKKTRSFVIEIVIYSFIFGFIIEDIEQIFNEKNQSFWKFYHKGLGNMYHIFTLLLSLICFVTRCSLPNKWFIVVRCFYAVMLSFYILKILFFCFYFESIGSKIIMMKNTIKDICFFLVIFIIFIIAYGTLLHSLQNPNSAFNWNLFSSIFYKPHFQFYGELMLDSFYGNSTDPKECNTLDCYIRHFASVVGLTIFLLLTTILLLNLLIAMFNYTFQSDIKHLNSFLRLQLFQKYQFKSCFPSPLNIVTLPFWITNYIRTKGNLKDYLIENFDDNEMKEISVIEDICAKRVLAKMNLKGNETSMKINL